MNLWITTIDPKLLDFWRTVMTVLVAIVAALIATSIQYRQWVTAREKLKLELFERRMKVYDAVVKAMLPSFPDWYKTEDMSEAGLAIAEAKWLFDSKTYQFLFDEVFRRLVGLQFTMERGTDDPDGLKKIRRETHAWAASNMTRLDSLMEPYLRMGR